MCAERDVVLTYVDLRWGVTGVQGVQAATLLMCLRELDRVSPFSLFGLPNENLTVLSQTSSSVSTANATVCMSVGASGRPHPAPRLVHVCGRQHEPSSDREGRPAQAQLRLGRQGVPLDRGVPRPLHYGAGDEDGAVPFELKVPFAHR